MMYTLRTATSAAVRLRRHIPLRKTLRTAIQSFSSFSGNDAVRDENSAGSVRGDILSRDQAAERLNRLVADAKRRDAEEEAEKVRGATRVEKKTFKSLGLPSYLWTKMEAEGFQRPTLIQRAAIPRMLRQKHNPLRLPVGDLIITDMTGSGKTLSFVLPMIANTNNFSNHLQGIIVVPTRELSVQIHKVVSNLCRGGSKKRKQNPVRVLRLAGSPGNIAATETVKREEPHILIGTPQILRAVLVEDKAVDLSHLTHAVFDEIDQLLSLPNDRNACLDLMGIGVASTPNMALRNNRDHETVASTQRRQLVFVSATVTQEVVNVAKRIMHNYEQASPREDPDELVRRNMKASEPRNKEASEASRTAVDPEADEKAMDIPLVPAHISHRYVVVNKNTLADLCVEAAGIVRTLKNRKKGIGVLLFVRNRHIVDTVAQHLSLAKIRAMGLHQSSSRQDRSRAFRLLAEGQLEVLVGTDMLARGLDIKGVTDIVNIGVPRSTNMYLHRSGRAGRLQGKHAKQSQVVSVVQPEEVGRMQAYAQVMKIDIIPSKRVQGKLQRLAPEDEAKLKAQREELPVVSHPLSPEAISFAGEDDAAFVNPTGALGRIVAKRKHLSRKEASAPARERYGRVKR